MSTALRRLRHVGRTVVLTVCVLAVPAVARGRTATPRTNPPSVSAQARGVEIPLAVERDGEGESAPVP